MLHFNKNYFSVSIVILIIEVAIALFIHDNFIRPYLGDALVVILMYCFLKSFARLPVLPAALCVLGFSFLVEILQWWNIVHKIGLGHLRLARIVIGTSFSWLDLVAYAAGVGMILVIEKYRLPRPGKAMWITRS